MKIEKKCFAGSFAKAIMTGFQHTRRNHALHFVPAGPGDRVGNAISGKEFILFRPAAGKNLPEPGK